MRTQSTALPMGAGRNKHLWCGSALPAMNRLQINRVKKEASWLIPIRVPGKKRNSGGKKPRASKVRYAVVKLGYIAQIAVFPAFKLAHDSELVALELRASDSVEGYCRNAIYIAIYDCGRGRLFVCRLGRRFKT
jgi:hypothetical protein